jgi:hypothetical protein
MDTALYILAGIVVFDLSIMAIGFLVVRTYYFFSDKSLTDEEITEKIQAFNIWLFKIILSLTAIGLLFFGVVGILWFGVKQIF